MSGLGKVHAVLRFLVGGGGVSDCTLAAFSILSTCLKAPAHARDFKMIFQ